MKRNLYFLSGLFFGIASFSCIAADGAIPPGLPPVVVHHPVVAAAAIVVADPVDAELEGSVREAASLPLYVGRIFIEYFHNNSGHLLKREHHEVTSGCWHREPPLEIPAHGWTVWASRSEGAAGATVGRVTYRRDGWGADQKIESRWNNPYAGSSVDSLTYNGPAIHAIVRSGGGTGQSHLIVRDFFR